MERWSSVWGEEIEAVICKAMQSIILLTFSAEHRLRCGVQVKGRTRGGLGGSQGIRGIEGRKTEKRRGEENQSWECMKLSQKDKHMFNYL